MENPLLTDTFLYDEETRKLDRLIYSFALCNHISFDEAKARIEAATKTSLFDFTTTVRKLIRESLNPSPP